MKETEDLKKQLETEGDVRDDGNDIDKDEMVKDMADLLRLQGEFENVLSSKDKTIKELEMKIDG